MVVRRRPRPFRAFGSTTLAGAVMLGAALVLGGCGGSSAGPSDPSRQMADANGRLRGRWILADFKPATPLEPMLATLLSVQLNLLAVVFDGAQMTASGVGVQATRTYQITEATMDDFTATIRDETGMTYDVTGSFQKNTLRFQSLTSPWTGQGTLIRSTP